MQESEIRRHIDMLCDLLDPIEGELVKRRMQNQPLYTRHGIGANIAQALGLTSGRHYWWDNTTERLGIYQLNGLEGVARQIRQKHKEVMSNV